jgi:mannose-6-phosphate isomerase-like protein (cupin superfamily)
LWAECFGRGKSEPGLFARIKTGLGQGVNLDIKALERQLHREGFPHTCVWQDGPEAFYPDHTHAVETAHIILDGEMTLMLSSTTKTYTAGERCDVPAGSVHSARMGSRGCRYLIGER